MYISDSQSNINSRYQYYYINIVAFDITHTIKLVFHSREFYDVLRVLIADATSFQALPAILDYVIQSASLSCWYRSDNKMNLRLRYCEFQKYEIMTMSALRDQTTKKHANTCYKATKHIERTFLISDY